MRMGILTDNLPWHHLRFIHTNATPYGPPVILAERYMRRQPRKVRW